MAGPVGPLVRGIGLSATGAGLWRDRNRLDPDAGYDRYFAVFAGCAQVRGETFPGDTDPGWLHRNVSRRASPVMAGIRLVQRPLLCAGPLPGGFRCRGDVDILGQRRAIELF